MTAPPEPPPPTSPETDAATGAEKTNGLWRYAWPRYWPAWLFVGWLWLTAQLPWQTAIALHKGLGRALYHLLPRSRLIVSRNLKICLPERTPAD